jgi:hypothetical protein
LNVRSVHTNESSGDAIADGEEGQQIQFWWHQHGSICARQVQSSFPDNLRMNDKWSTWNEVDAPHSIKGFNDDEDR